MSIQLATLLMVAASIGEYKMGDKMKRYIHDSTCCTFHGHMQPYDVYTCVTTVILRYGDKGEEYLSLDKSVLSRVGGVWEDARQFLMLK